MYYIYNIYTHVLTAPMSAGPFDLAVVRGASKVVADLGGSHYSTPYAYINIAIDTGYIK